MSKCIRCEIIRAKVRATVMAGMGRNIDTIVMELNNAYTGLFVAHSEGQAIVVRRYPVKDGVKLDPEGVVILSVNKEIYLLKSLDNANQAS